MSGFRERTQDLRRRRADALGTLGRQPGVRSRAEGSEPVTTRRAGGAFEGRATKRLERP